MTIPDGRRFATPSSPRDSTGDRPYVHAERIQRDYELGRALEAARTLQQRLEMLGDRASDVAVIRSLRDSLARDIEANGR